MQKRLAFFLFLAHAFRSLHSFLPCIIYILENPGTETLFPIRSTLDVIGKPEDVQSSQDSCKDVFHPQQRQDANRDVRLGWGGGGECVGEREREK